MAIYRFKVTFEDYDDVIREIDILSKHTFLDLHRAIQKSVNYDPEKSSSFYVSNDQWKKGEEIAYLPTEFKSNKGVTLMETAKLNKFIDDPHQKFYYIYNFDRPYDFHVQLIKILKEEEGKEYPAVFKSIGIAPKTTGTISTDESGSDKEEKSDFDFLHDMGYDAEDDNNLDLMDDEDGGDSDFSDDAPAEDEY